MHFAGIDDEVPEDVGRHILSFLDFPTLVQKKAVCCSWQILFTNTIRERESTPKPFQSRDKLKEAVDKYTKYNLDDAEEFAETYGWPIGRWDVSNIQDFSFLFYEKSSFNENIGSWDVSSATSMSHMFHGATAFNQDISSWNTSNVQNMNCMFYHATHFNRDIVLWDISNVRTMSSMFVRDTTSFDQDLSFWGRRLQPP
eukprot:scaffold39659_cov52-Attheya_sp.AAC.4